MNKDNVIFVQKFNFLSFLYIVLYGWKINRVILHETYAYSNISKNALKHGEFWKKILSLLRRKIKFEIVPEILAGKNTTFEANSLGTYYFNSQDWNNVSSKEQEYFNKHLGSSHFQLALNCTIRDELTKKILFYLQAQDLEKTYKEKLQAIIPSEIEYFKIKDYLQYNSNKIQSSFNLLYKTKDLFLSFFLISEVLFRPWIELFINGIKIKKIKLRYFDIAQHLASGMGEVKSNIKRGLVDEILKKRLIEKGDFSFLYVFGVWKFTKNEYINFKKSIKEQGADYAWEWSNRIPLMFFLKEYLLKFSLTFFVYFSKRLFLNGHSVIPLIMATRRIQLYAVKFDLFCQHFRVKVFVSKDDYSFYSTIRTIIQNKYSLKNVAISHSQCTDFRNLPGTCFAFFDIYFTRGSQYRKIFYPFWENIKKIEVVGQMNSDFIYEAKKNTDVETKFKNKYKDSINILVPISLPSWRKFRHDMLETKYRDLPDLLELNDKIHLILRPRATRKAVDYFFENFPKYQKWAKKQRISVELDDFTIYELAAYCDLVIGEDQSGIVLESIAAKGAWPVAYALRFDQYHLKDYHKIFVAQNIDEMKFIVSSFINKNFDPSVYSALTKIQENLAPTFDDSWDRVANKIVDLL